MKILVMGGTRFVGKSLVSKLLNQNHEIDIFTRGNKSNPDNTNLIKGDRNDIECILKIKNKKLSYKSEFLQVPVALLYICNYEALVLKATRYLGRPRATRMAVAENCLFASRRMSS